MSKPLSNPTAPVYPEGVLDTRRALAGKASLVYDDPKHHIRLYQGDCLEVLAQIPESSVDLVFADPPYFLSNGGITCHAGKMVSVHKGDWDKLPGADGGPVRARFDKVHEFNTAWLAAAQRVLKPNGSIWVSGTAHVIHSVGFAMQQLGFKLLNDISWVKPNPPPNLSCRYFTHATETIIWAAKNKKSRHTFHYKLMKELNRGKQMKSVWEIRPPEPWEKKFGKHPTQKPVALLERILLASTSEGDLVLDPFVGSGTTALAALRLRRRALGCDLSLDFLQLTVRRLCSELAHVHLSVASFHFSVDLPPDPVDRSDRAFCSAGVSPAPAFSGCSGRSFAKFASRSLFDREDRLLGSAGILPAGLSSRVERGICFSGSHLSSSLQLVQRELRFYFKEYGGYVVVCPSLPGCYSQGKTVSEALANIREAIDLCIEDMESRGEEIPDPNNVLIGSVVVTR